MGETDKESKKKDSDASEAAIRDADFSVLDQENSPDSGQAGTGAPVPDSGALEADTAKCKAELEALKQELAETKERYLRSLAELENFKKRALRERSELLKYQGEQVLLDVLAVADNMELAMQHLDADPAQLKTGIQMIHKLLVDVLAKWDVKPLESIGKEFDPSMFAALSQVRVDDAKPGTIINEIKKGYTFKDRLLRPGQVVVAAQPPAAEAIEPGEQESSGPTG